MEPYESYEVKTRKYFSDILRSIFGTDPRVIHYKSRKEIHEILSLLSSKLHNERELSYIWWWRGGRNCHLYRFLYDYTYLYLNDEKMMVSEILIQLSPIPRFDFIYIGIQGNVIEKPQISNYEFNNNDFREVDLNIDEIYPYSIKTYNNNEGTYSYNYPFNIIITAQFGLPNLNGNSNDSAFEKLLNKVLFGVISLEQFLEAYNRPLKKLEYRIEDFYNHLEKYPMLGLEHTLGNYIYENIDSAPTISINGNYFRARNNNEKSYPFEEHEMWNPPRGEVPIFGGRFNHFGQSFLYLAENQRTAFRETVPEEHVSCSMLEINVSDVNKILDLRVTNYFEDNKFGLFHYMLTHEKSVGLEVTNENIQKEYLVPRFISDIIRIKGYNGILFTSTKTGKDNLVLYTPNLIRNKEKLKALDTPFIYKAINS